MTERSFKVGDVISLKDTEKIALNNYNRIRAKNYDSVQFWREFREIMNDRIKLKIVSLPEVD